MGHPLAIERLGETRAGAGVAARQAEREEQSALTARDAETNAKFHTSIHAVARGLEGVASSGSYSGYKHEMTFASSKLARTALRAFARATAPGPKRAIRAPDGHWVIAEPKTGDPRTIVIRAAKLRLVR